MSASVAPGVYTPRRPCLSHLTFQCGRLDKRSRRQQQVPAGAQPLVPERDVVAPPPLLTAPSALVQRLLQPEEPALPSGSDVPELEVDVVGTAWHLGVDMEWRLSFSTDGSFREELSSPQTSYSSGYCAHSVAGTCEPGSSGGSREAGVQSSDYASSSTRSSSSSSSSSRDGGGRDSYCCAPGVCWGSDDAGCPRRMQLDDEEALLLSTWVRAGVWVLPSVARHLSIRSVAAPPRAAHAEDGDGMAASATADGSGSHGSSGAGATWVELRMLDGGQVTALVELCTATWRPLSAQLQLAGENELWLFNDWREWHPGMWAAAGAVQTSSGEGSPRNEYQLASLTVRPAPSRRGGVVSSQAPSRFAPPPTPLLPADSAFLPGYPEGVPAWHTVSGHCLVKPRLNGKEVGFFILDTGASGFVLDPQAADSLGLEGFGELQVISMVGRISSRFRRGASFQLGPLRMERPLFMELPCSGIVSGVPDGGRVVGIVGYDVLRRAVVHMPPHPRRPTLPASATNTVDSPAAAFAATASAARIRNSPLPLTVHLQHPAAIEPAGTWNGLQLSSSSPISNCAAVSVGSGPALHAASSSPAAAAAAVSSLASSGSGSGSHSGAASCAAAPSALPSSSTHHSNNVSSSSAGRYSRRRHRQSLPPLPPLQLHPEVQWLPLVMVSSLPHVELELVTAEGRQHRGLFMMDSGAGGFDLIIGARAAQAMQLSDSAVGVTQIKGVGSGSGDKITARRCQLAEVRLGAYSFRRVQALFHGAPPSGGASGAGLELSQHTSGIVCAGLLGRCGLTFDYARMRVGVAGPTSAYVLSGS